MLSGHQCRCKLILSNYLLLSVVGRVVSKLTAICVILLFEGTGNDIASCLKLASRTDSGTVVVLLGDLLPLEMGRAHLFIILQLLISGNRCQDLMSKNKQSRV